MSTSVEVQASVLYWDILQVHGSICQILTFLLLQENPKGDTGKLWLAVPGLKLIFLILVNVL
jgi:hypothetical protein